MAIPTTFIPNPRLTRSQVPNAVWVQISEYRWNLRRTVDSGSRLIAAVQSLTTPDLHEIKYRVGIQSVGKLMQRVGDDHETLEEAMHVAEMLYLTGAYD